MSSGESDAIRHQPIRTLSREEMFPNEMFLHSDFDTFNTYTIPPDDRMTIIEALQCLAKTSPTLTNESFARITRILRYLR